MQHCVVSWRVFCCVGINGSFFKNVCSVNGCKGIGLGMKVNGCAKNVLVAHAFGLLWQLRLDKFGVGAFEKLLLIAHLSRALDLAENGRLP